MKKIFNLLVVLMVALVLVSCGVSVPENKDITFTSKEYYPNIYIENVYVNMTGSKIDTRDANEDDINRIMRVFQTTYKGVSIGDTVEKLDSIYGWHITSITYYDDMRFGKYADFTFVWGDAGEVQMTIPASYADNNYVKINPLSVNKDMMELAYKQGKEVNMSKEEIVDEIKAQFFQPVILIMNGEEAIQQISFDKIDEAISGLKEDKDRAQNIATSNTVSDKDSATGLPLLFPIESDAKEVFAQNDGYLLPFNHMGESIESVADAIGSNVKASYIAWTLNYGPNGKYDLTATYYDNNENPIADLSFGLDNNFIANTDIWFNDYKSGKSLHEIDVIWYAQGN